MNKHMKRNYSKLSNRIMIRYVIYWLLMLLAFVTIYLLCAFFLGRFSWRPEDPVYLFLKMLERYAPWLIIIGQLIGTMILTYKAIRKSLGFIDITLDAAQTLSSPSAEMILLPEELIDVQNELNLVRETSLRNMTTAREAEQRKNDLVMYLAHDLKTPLASVIGYLNLLQDANELPEETRRKYLDITLQKSERLEELINEFFEISRFNLSNVTLDYQTIDLTRMLEQTVFEFQPMFQERGLSCDLQVKEPIILKCDPNKLQRVFDNLLRNAASYSYPDSVITISLSEKDDSSIVNLDFTNTGEMISKDKLDRIFEQFYRIDAARSSAEGSGLGLAIAKQIIELHGGTISASSSDEKTVFSVSLPLS